MNDQAERLRLKEQDRRNALWKLQGLRPGEPAAAAFIAALDTVDALDVADPIGPAFTLSVKQIREQVPVTVMGEFRIIRDEDLPEPWAERFGQASVGSGRFPEGYYVRDWLNFLSLWEKEMLQLDRHRRMRHLWCHEQARWDLLKKLRGHQPGDPDAEPLLLALVELEAMDDPRFASMETMREHIHATRQPNGNMAIDDRNLPLPWNLRYAQFLGCADAKKKWWDQERWPSFLDTWHRAQIKAEAHRRGLQD